MKRMIWCVTAFLLLLMLSACGEKRIEAGSGNTDAPKLSETKDSISEDAETPTVETTRDSDAENAETGAERSTTESDITAPTTDNLPVTDSPATNPPATDIPVISDPPVTNLPATQPPKQETEPVIETCSHFNTEVRNESDATTSADGYTGDIYCRDCGTLLSYGESIPKIKQTVSVCHDYYDIEMEIFRLINEERAANGVAPLVWDEELYAGTKVRATEVATYYSHTRPNGDKYYTALSGMYSYVGENFLRAVINCVSSDPAGMMMDAWIESEAHHNNMLNSGYGHTAIAIIKYNDEYVAVNIFTN